MRLLMVFALGVVAGCATDRVSVGRQVDEELRQRLESRLTPFIEKALADHDAVGMSIAVATADGVVYSRGFGVQHVDTRSPTTPQTVYHTASISKLFTAAAVLVLRDQGRLDLDRPVVAYLPQFRTRDPASERITLREILTHTSGLPRDDTTNNWGGDSEPRDDLSQLVERLVDRELVAPPGDRFSYSNLGYSVLGAVIERVTEQPFERAMDSLILGPAGLSDSTFGFVDPVPANWAWPHEVVTDSIPLPSYPYNSAYAPAATLHSSAEDLARFATLHLSARASNRKLPLSDASLEELWSEQASTPWGEHIGLGWFVQSYEGRETRLHTGEDPGFEGQLIVYPDDNLVIVVLANRLYTPTARIANATAEVAFDLDIKPYRVSGRIPFGRVWADSGFDAAVAVWESLKDDSNFITNEWEMNVVGHSMIRAGRLDDARRAFQYNIDAYPASANTYDSYGDALRAEGRLEDALVYFRRALTVDPDFEEPLPKIAAIEQQLSQSE